MTRMEMIDSILYKTLSETYFISAQKSGAILPHIRYNVTELLGFFEIYEPWVLVVES